MLSTRSKPLVNLLKKVISPSALEPTTVVLLNGHTAKLPSKYLFYTHRLVLFSTLVRESFCFALVLVLCSRREGAC